METLAPEVIRNLYPLNQLPEDSLRELLPFMRTRWVSRGTQLFDYGEDPDDYGYVLEGSVWLTDQKEEHMHAVEPAWEKESIPLPYVLPSVQRATATTDCKLLMVDRRRLAQVLSKFSLGVSHAKALSTRGEQATADPDAWQAAMLRCPGFQRVPGCNMQRAFKLMRPVDVKAGECVITQGAPSDDFYVIAEGRCEVLRCFVTGHPVRIAEFGVGDTFGEDSLVSDTPRNATVRMLTDGRVMRLDGDDFRFLIKRALLQPVNIQQASHLIAQGGCWFDVRLPSERNGASLPGAVTIPHTVARTVPFRGHAYRRYVVVCANGFDSPAIAFTLCKLGYDAYSLKGGIAGVRNEDAALLKTQKAAWA